MVTVVLLSHAQNALPDIVCALQVALEGAITAKAALTNLSKGEMPQGDLIPWTIGQQFQDPDFPGLSGARVVRIAVHPELQKAGYGARALELLRRYYQGELQGLGEGDDEGDDEDGTQGAKVGADAWKSVCGRLVRLVLYRSRYDLIMSYHHELRVSVGCSLLQLIWYWLCMLCSSHAFKYVMFAEQYHPL